MQRFVLPLTLACVCALPAAAQLGDLTKAAGLDTKALAAGAASDLLTVENFDPDAVKALIDGAPLEAAQKDTLKAGVDQAAENPEMVQAALDQVKAALGQ